MITDINISALRRLKESSTAALAAEQTQRILWLPFWVGLGISLYLAAPNSPPLWIVGAAAVPLVWLRWRCRHVGGAKFVLHIALAVLLGFAAMQLRDFYMAHDVLSRAAGPIRIQGTITDLDYKEKTVRITLSDVVAVENKYNAPVPSRLRLSVRTSIPQDWRAGDQIEALARLMPLTAPTQPGGYDFAILQYYKGLGATGFTFGQPHLVAKSAPRALDEWLEAARQHVRQKINGALPDNQPAAAIATAILTGEQNEIPATAADVLRDSGLYHIISISGLHISYVAMLVFFLVRRGLALSPTLALYWPLKKIGAVLALLAIVGYTMFAGAPTPAQRSCLMAGLVLLAVMLDRHAISLRTVAIAALVILILEPEQIYSVSFQLSFAAVTALVAAFEYFHSRLLLWLEDKPLPIRLARGALELLLTSIVATLATMPFVFYHFQSSQIFGVLANMVAVPLTGLWVMPFGVLVLMLAPFGLEAFAVQGMALGIDIILHVAAWVAAMPGAVWLMPALPPLAILPIAFGFLWLCLWQGTWRLWGIPILLLGFAMLPLAPQPDVLVAPGGKLIAVRENSKIHFIGTGRESYYHQSWARHFALKPDAIAAQQNPPELQCDEDRCLIVRDGQMLALIRTEQGFFQSCTEGAAIIKTIRRIKGFKGQCPTARVLRYWDSMDNGTYAFNFHDGAWRYESVNDQRGNRPWVRPTDWAIQPD